MKTRLPPRCPSLYCMLKYFNSSYRLCATVWGAPIGWRTGYWKLVYWILLFYRRLIYLLKAISFPVLQRVSYHHSLGIGIHQPVGVLYSSGNSFTNTISLLVPTIFLWSTYTLLKEFMTSNASCNESSLKHCLVFWLHTKFYLSNQCVSI